MKIVFYFFILYVLIPFHLLCEVTDSLDIAKLPTQITILEFGADNCYYCKKMTKVLNEINLEFGDTVRIEFVDFNDPQKQRIVNKYFVKEIPTQIFLDSDDKVIFRHIGFLSQDKIRQKLDELIIQ